MVVVVLAVVVVVVIVVVVTTDSGVADVVALVVVLVVLAAVGVVLTVVVLEIGAAGVAVVNVGHLNWLKNSSLARASKLKVMNKCSIYGGDAMLISSALNVPDPAPAPIPKQTNGEANGVQFANNRPRTNKMKPDPVWNQIFASLTAFLPRMEKTQAFWPVYFYKGIKEE